MYSFSKNTLKILARDPTCPISLSPVFLHSLQLYHLRAEPILPPTKHDISWCVGIRTRCRPNRRTGRCWGQSPEDERCPPGPGSAALSSAPRLGFAKKRCFQVTQVLGSKGMKAMRQVAGQVFLSFFIKFGSQTWLRSKLVIKSGSKSTT